jgi:choline kinase
MKVIILAAGIGNRLGKYSNDNPKSLLEFDGKSLLKRHIEILKELYVEEIVIITGYKSEMIVEHLNDASIPIRFIFNERYAEGSIISLGCAYDILTNESDFILMDADVLYDKNILSRLFETKNKNCFLLDRNFESGDEPVKICVDKNGIINEFRKKISANHTYDFQGESVGFFKFDASVGKSLASVINECIERGETEMPYEDAIREVLFKFPERFGFEDISGLPWIEIDFPDDIERATHEILQKISDIN